MAKSVLGDEMFPDKVRIYKNMSNKDQLPDYKIIYEGNACIQERDAGSENYNVDNSEYVAYIQDNNVSFPSAGCLIDWQNFNHPFSDNSNNWRSIKKPPFNYEDFGTVVYFNQVEN